MKKNVYSLLVMVALRLRLHLQPARMTMTILHLWKLN